MKKSMVKRGPPRDFEMVARVVRMRRSQMSYRQIAKELKRDIKTVYRWASYAVGSFPQAVEK